MKLKVIVTLKPGVLDPQGRAVHKALEDLGYDAVSEVRTGKVLLLDLDLDDPESAAVQTREMCEKLLANPVIEQFEITPLD